jgi:hypothetical protein
VWDISGLRKKSVAPGPGGLDDHLKNPGTTDLFGQVGATRADRKKLIFQLSNREYNYGIQFYIALGTVCYFEEIFS